MICLNLERTLRRVRNQTSNKTYLILQTSPFWPATFLLMRMGLKLSKNKTMNWIILL
jgi:hypothetical protein